MVEDCDMRSIGGIKFEKWENPEKKATLSATHIRNYSSYKVHEKMLLV